MIANTNDINIMTSQIVQQMAKYARTGTKDWDYKIALTDLPVQVGCLTKPVMQLHGERYSYGFSNDQIKEKISDELADILSLVLFIANDLSIDIKKSWANMINSDNLKIEERQGVINPTL